MKKVVLFCFLLIGLAFMISEYTGVGRSLWYPYLSRYFHYSLEDRLNQYEDSVTNRLSPLFKKAGIKSGYPDELLILAFKQERVVELLGRKSGDKGYRFIKRYPIRAASGMLGPKLREGDYQVPEGFYRITFLHPNSSYHLSMKLNYPNEDDLKYAKKEGRTSPGSNIFIHGKAVSRGCIALGDSAIEELFVLVAKAGKSHAQVVISPFDFRKKQSIALPGEPEWIVARYKKIEEYLKKIPDETKDLDEK